MATSDFTKRLAYQGMLLNVSNRLSSDNLRNLKYLVKDDLPADKLEDATQGTVLFTLLQQQGRLFKRRVLVCAFILCCGDVVMLAICW